MRSCFFFGGGGGLGDNCSRLDRSKERVGAHEHQDRGMSGGQWRMG